MYVEARKLLVDWLRQQLIGPADEGKLLRISPLDRYPTGVLHPVGPSVPGIDPASAGGEEGLLDDEDDEPTDDEEGGQAFAQPARRRRYVPPSSAGFSIFVRGEAPRLAITCKASVYVGTAERDPKGQFRRAEYARTELPERTVEWSSATARDDSVETIWEDKTQAGVHVRARPHRDGLIVTVTLCNRAGMAPDVPLRLETRTRVAQSLFEAEVSCVVEDGELAEYPRVDPSLLTDEEQELELQYREQRIYAVGHGTAVNWQVPETGKARVWSEFMPAVDVPMVTVKTSAGDDDAVLRLAHLAERPMNDALESFVDGYARWIAEQEGVAAKLAGVGEQEPANRICKRMKIALERMRRCVTMLRTDSVAAESFRIANQVMLDQMVQAHRVEGKATELDDYRWRPFQLAFLLTVMESAIREDDEFRDVLDLIWFPTGGGKTEAYFGLIAFLIAWRRLKHPDTGGGTAAFMRYTLRLLTRQQFERAARMMCAMELLRRRRPERLGTAPIDVGIWVGGAISPNRYDQAMEIVEEIRGGKAGSQYKLVMDACPWCGNAFDATHGYDATEDGFHLHCNDPGCDFGKERAPLPCNVVDDALYDQPPTLLIGTIDKFARVAWEERTGAFFGVASDARPTSRPPELVIQDELHLITGPLGSVAGVYEAGFDTLLSGRGVRPKYVASTATIHMAREQVQRVYARDLAVFPPPGLSHDDTYFARTDREQPGRLYVGYLAPLLDQHHCMAPIAAALLAAPGILFEEAMDRNALLDAWWTQVVYHGTLKGVGNSHNAFGTDVRDFGRRIVQEARESAGEAGYADDDSDATSDEASPEAFEGMFNGVMDRFLKTRIAQLTSRRTARENAETFQQLTQFQGGDACLDAVLATNMVSVGLDVARLALMIVNGQPLTTAEYIQATSRVGRADVPGVVVANYYRHQARSLSHYESFRPYHESFYRFVEPGSVTPHTWQVRSRALHAALVIAIRHQCDELRSNTAASNFDKNAPDVKAVVEDFKQRCERAAASSRGHDIASHIDRLVEEWHEEARRCEQERRQLNYTTPNNERNADRLLHAHGDKQRGLWATLHSMRNVEGHGSLRIHDWPPR